ncbi:MAG: cell envelope integrity protein CreD [Bacteroidota bacterium]
MNTENTRPANSISTWLRESVMVKITVIGLLILFLLIPSSWVNSLMEERQGRVTEAIEEVSQKWSTAQHVTGPMLVLPYKKTIITKITTADKKTEDKIETYTEEASFLPHELNINGNLKPQNLTRGIFDVVVYNSTIAMKGYFEKPNLATLGIKPEDVYWNKAYLVNGLSDLRGIGENPKISFNHTVYQSEPSNMFEESNLFRKNFSSFVRISPSDSIIPFTISFPLKGSSNLYFYPMGKSTHVTLAGEWSNPKFDGFYLPENRNVTERFTANWKILNFNRPFPQQWVTTPANIESTAFGVNLIMPVDQYQKSIRTSKYGILIILLTFVSLLLIELIVKKHIHPFQYTLIGIALTIYYTLLLSISEHIGFNFSYLISSAVIIMLISLYSISIFNNRKITALLASLLTIFYTYIFVITQQQDYALLLGSIGLLIIIAVLMYVSRKIDWYGARNKTIQQHENETTAH